MTTIPCRPRSRNGFRSSARSLHISFRVCNFLLLASSWLKRSRMALDAFWCSAVRKLSPAPASAKGTGQPSRSGLLLRELGPSAVPQREGEAKSCLLITNAHQAVLTQPICARTGVIVWRVFPCRALLAVILAHRAPLPIQVGPASPKFYGNPRKSSWQSPTLPSPTLPRVMLFNRRQRPCGNRRSRQFPAVVKRGR